MTEEWGLGGRQIWPCHLDVDPVHRELLPEDAHPRVLIQAIQKNLGITKKAISERTGISYGTLNRYTRTPACVGRPRRTSIERLRKLYAHSLQRIDAGSGGSGYGGYGGYGGYDSGGYDSGGAGPRPGAAHRASLLAGLPHPGRERSQPVDLREMPRDPFLKFLRRLSGYAEADVARFLESDCRDRTRLLETRELVGDLYLALVSDLVDCAVPVSASTPRE